MVDNRIGTVIATLLAAMMAERESVVSPTRRSCDGCCSCRATSPVEA